jgi:hypothetical protein
VLWCHAGHPFERVAECAIRCVTQRLAELGDGHLTLTQRLLREAHSQAAHFSISDQRAFNFFITHAADGRELVYMVEYADRLGAVLAAVVEMQDNADEGGQRTHVGNGAPERVRRYSSDSDRQEWTRIFEQIGQAIERAFKELTK